MVFLKTMKSYVCLLLLLQSILLSSQTKAQLLEYLYTNYYRTYESQTDSALLYIKQAHRIAVRINDINWLAKTNHGLGNCYYIKRNDSLCLVYTEKAITYAIKAQNDDILSRAFNQKGLIYSFKNDYKKALTYFHKSLKISENKNILDDNTISVLSNIADIHIWQQDTLKGLDYYYQAKKIGENNRSIRILSVYNNLGTLYMGNKKDSALFYFKKSLHAYEQNNNLNGQVNANINIAITYLNFNSVNDYPEALKRLLKANDIAIQLNNSESQFFSNFFLGSYYEKVERNNLKAQSYYEKTLKFLKSGYKNEYTIQLYKSLSRIARKQEDYKTAYEFQVKFQELQDSVFSVEKNKQFHEIQTKFDVEQKNSRIQLLNKENEIQSKQKSWIFITATILVLLLIIIAYAYKKEAKSQKIIRNRDLLLFEKEREASEQQKKLNEIKFLIAGQNQERARISKDLHDGIGSFVAAIKMNLAALNQNEIKNNRLNLHIEQLNDVSKEIRVISHSIGTSIDSDKPLLELMNDLIEIYQFNRKFKMSLTLFPEDCLNDLDEFTKINLYRIFQEAFANISKHSQARKVEISCTLHKDELIIIIEDDGTGFDPDNSPGIGIKNIKERIRELNGIVSIDSNKNKGTSVSFQIQHIKNKK